MEYQQKIPGLINLLYRSKPIEVEAIKWTGDNYNECFDWGEGYIHTDAEENLYLNIGENNNRRWFFIPVNNWLLRQKESMNKIWTISSEDFDIFYEEIGVQGPLGVKGPDGVGSPDGKRGPDGVPIGPKTDLERKTWLKTLLPKDK